MDKLNNSQLEMLKKFKEFADPFIDDPHYRIDEHHLRWLKARRFDLEKAKEMFSKSMAWRKSYGTDTILKDWKVPEVMDKYWSGGVFGEDRDGRPCFYQLSKNFDTKGMIRSAKKSDMVKLHVYRMELLMRKMKEQSIALDKPITNSTHISDLDGFNMNMLMNSCMSDAMKQVFAIYEANYPEITYTSFVINAPSFFPIIFILLKPFLSEETKAKVHILGKGSWKKELNTTVDDSQLPEYWQGTAKYGSIYKVTHASKIPEDYYTYGKITTDKQLTNKTIAKSCICDIKFSVLTPGTLFRWCFITEDYDISYAVILGKTFIESSSSDFSTSVNCANIYVDNKQTTDNLDFSEILDDESLVDNSNGDENANTSDKSNLVNNIDSEDISNSGLNKKQITQFVEGKCTKKDSSLKLGEQYLQEIQRVNSHLVPEDGTIVCKYAGDYIFRFDNTYSWLRNKVVSYEFELIVPKQDDIVKMNY